MYYHHHNISSIVIACFAAIFACEVKFCISTYDRRRSSHNFYIKIALFWNSQLCYDFRTGNILKRFVCGRVRFVFGVASFRERRVCIYHTLIYYSMVDIYIYIDSDSFERIISIGHYSYLDHKTWRSRF